MARSFFQWWNPAFFWRIWGVALLAWHFAGGSSAAQFARPANDDFDQAIELSGPDVTFGGSLYGATREAGELEDGGDGSICWSWKAPASGTTLIYVTERRGYPGVLWVFDSNDLAAARLPGNTVAEIPFGMRAYTRFRAEGGRTYRFALCASAISPSQYELRLVQLPGRPVVVDPPKSEAVLVGEDALFTVAAISDLENVLQFQWQFNGVDLPGERFPMLVLTNVSPIQAGDYRAVVSGLASDGSTTRAASGSAQLIVREAEVPPRVEIVHSQSHPEFVSIKVSGEGDRTAVLRQSRDLVSWQGGSGPWNSLFEVRMVPGGAEFLRISWYKQLNPRCHLNLRQLQFAEGLWAGTYGKRLGDAMTEGDVLPYFKGGIPTCPVGGVYNRGKCQNNVCSFSFVGSWPQCVVAGHVLP